MTTRSRTSSAGRDFRPFPASISKPILDPMAHDLEAAEHTAGRDSTGTGAAIARIDDALAASISRNAFSRDQALRTLGEVEASVGDPTVTDRVAAVVNEAAASYCGEALADRGCFLDTLLDMRALLVGCSRGAEGAA